MKIIFGIFSLFIVLFIWAFLLESQEALEPSLNNPNKIAGSFKRDTPKWNIPANFESGSSGKTLTENILDDDICSLLMDADINDYNKLLTAYLASMSKGEDNHQLIAALDDDENSGSLSSKFYHALRLGGLLNGPIHQTKFDEALNELQALERLDPDNGAYPLFATVLMLELQYPVRDQIDSLAIAFKRQRLDTFQSDIARALVDSGKTSATRFLVAQILLSQMPGPRFSEVQTLVQRLLHRSGNKLDALALNFSNKVIEDINRSGDSADMAEYQAFKSIYTQAYRKLYSESPQLSDDENLSRRPASWVGNAILEVIEPMQKARKCDRGSIDEVYFSWKLSLER